MRGGSLWGAFLHPFGAVPGFVERPWVKEFVDELYQVGFHLCCMEFL